MDVRVLAGRVLASEFDQVVERKGALAQQGIDFFGDEAMEAAVGVEFAGGDAVEQALQDAGRGGGFGGFGGDGAPPG
ncbi:MAG: hypothetical protein IT318_01995 [Anaerolineales bacterium]|nr:hypothetical protein [Anaerolineales bacterium]